MSITLPLGEGIPLAGVGDLLSIELAAGADVRGIVGAVAIHAERGGYVTQTVRLGEETGNRRAAWRGLTRPDPLLWATVLAIHATAHTPSSTRAAALSVLPARRQWMMSCGSNRGTSRAWRQPCRPMI